MSWVPQPGSRTVLLVLLWLAFRAPAGAESKDVNALRQEIQELRGAVERLDGRVQALEQQRPPNRGRARPQANLRRPPRPPPLPVSKTAGSASSEA
jgi:hypothetical protein